jgi:hypothetical protein
MILKMRSSQLTTVVPGERSNFVIVLFAPSGLLISLQDYEICRAIGSQ